MPERVDQVGREGDGAEDLLVPLFDGSVVSLTLLGTTTSFIVNTSGDSVSGQVDLRDVPAADLSSAILQELIGRLQTDHSDDALGSITRGYLDGAGVFHADNGPESTALYITADRYGQKVLGAPQGQGTMPRVAAVHAQIRNGDDEVDFSNTAIQAKAGKVVFASTSDGANIHNGTGTGTESGGQVGRNESVIRHQDEGGEFGNGGYIIDDITNADPGRGLYDSEKTEFADLDIDDTDERGVSPGVIDQSYTNAGNGQTGGNPTYYGEGPRTGSSGVQQTHQNPDGSYTATDGSPATNTGNVSTGEDDHYGGSSSHYDEDGLHTDHLDDGTPVPGDDGSHYEVGEVDVETDVDGVSQGESSNADSDDDGFHVDTIREGFAAFTWDDAIRQVASHASRDADVINNFQIDYDVINIEGALAQNLGVDEVDHVEAQTIWSRAAGTTLDLDTVEFGIVSRQANYNSRDGVDTAHLSDATAIAELLGSVFDLRANGEDDDLNTTIFAITAEDDPDTTAIWVHSQSAADDDTIGANELTLLAIVHSTGGSFGSDNLQMLDYQGGWLP